MELLHARLTCEFSESVTPARSSTSVHSTSRGACSTASTMSRTSSARTRNFRTICKRFRLLARASAPLSPGTWRTRWDGEFGSPPKVVPDVHDSGPWSIEFLGAQCTAARKQAVHWPLGSPSFKVVTSMVRKEVSLVVHVCVSLLVPESGPVQQVPWSDLTSGEVTA